MDGRVFVIALMGMAIFLFIVKEGMKIEREKVKSKAEAHTTNNVALEQRVEELEERVRVLERIATDKGRTLADEIDQLSA